APAPVASSEPGAAMVATAASATDHCACAVRSACEPSLYTPDAVKDAASPLGTAALGPETERLRSSRPGSAGALADLELCEHAAERSAAASCRGSFSWRIGPI